MACNYGLLCLNYGLLSCTVECNLRFLAFLIGDTGAGASMMHGSASAEECVQTCLIVLAAGAGAHCATLHPKQHAEVICRSPTVEASRITNILAPHSESSHSIIYLEYISQ